MKMSRPPSDTIIQNQRHPNHKPSHLIRKRMAKVDLKKELSDLYQPSAKEVTEVDVPTFRYLMIDGQGDPNSSPEYAEAVEALFSVSYTAKFMLKKGVQALDYAVMPLEGLWWADDMAAFVANDKAQWKWTMMIMQPAFVDAETIAQAMTDVLKKKNCWPYRNCAWNPSAKDAARRFCISARFLKKGQRYNVCMISSTPALAAPANTTKFISVISGVPTPPIGKPSFAILCCERIPLR
jgi:hypothetical protein